MQIFTKVHNYNIEVPNKDIRKIVPVSAKRFGSDSFERFERPIICHGEYIAWDGSMKETPKQKIALHKYINTSAS